jgi:hypothetical protein
MKTVETDMDVLRAARPDLTQRASQVVDEQERSLLLERIMATSVPATLAEATASDQVLITRSSTPTASQTHLRRWLTPAIAAACVPVILARDRGWACAPWWQLRPWRAQCRDRACRVHEQRPGREAVLHPRATIGCCR